jgi:hypothetical protein
VTVSLWPLCRPAQPIGGIAYVGRSCLVMMTVVCGMTRPWRGLIDLLCIDRYLTHFLSARLQLILRRSQLHQSGLAATFLVGTAALLWIVLVVTAPTDEASFSSSSNSALRVEASGASSPPPPRNAIVIHRALPEANIQLHLRRQSDNPVDVADDHDHGAAVVASLGPHVVMMHIANPKRCPRPSVAIRVTGDARLHVRLVEHSPAEWSGRFRLPPQNGTYGVEVRWYGCDGAATTTSASSAAPSAYTTLEEPILFAAVHCDVDDDDAGPTRETRTPPLFAEPAAWIRTNSVPQYATLAEELTSPPLPPYLWRNVKSDPMAGHLLRTATPNNGSYVSTEGTLKHPDDYYKFADVSNYELVWYVSGIGSWDSGEIPINAFSSDSFFSSSSPKACSEARPCTTRGPPSST